jgi:hypothetical protein
MKTRKYWIARTISGLYRQVNQTYNCLKRIDVRQRYGLGTGNVAVGGGIDKIETPTGKWFDDIFVPSLLNFNAAYVAWENPDTRNRMIIVNIHEARKKLTNRFTQLYLGVIKYCPTGTNDDLAEMGLPVYENRRRKGALKAAAHPPADVAVPELATVEFNAHDEGFAKNGKPVCQAGVEVYYRVSDTAILDWEELVHSEYSSKTNFRITFSGKDRGRLVYYAFRWENTRAEKGAWSNIHSIIIP